MSASSFSSRATRPRSLESIRQEFFAQYQVQLPKNPDEVSQFVTAITRRVGAADEQVGTSGEQGQQGQGQGQGQQGGPRDADETTRSTTTRRSPRARGPAGAPAPRGLETETTQRPASSSSAASSSSNSVSRVLADTDHELLDQVRSDQENENHQERAPPVLPEDESSRGASTSATRSGEEQGTRPSGRRGGSRTTTDVYLGANNPGGGGEQRAAPSSVDVLDETAEHGSSASSAAAGGVLVADLPGGFPRTIASPGPRAAPSQHENEQLVADLLRQIDELSSLSSQRVEITASSSTSPSSAVHGAAITNVVPARATGFGVLQHESAVVPASQPAPGVVVATAHAALVQENYPSSHHASSSASELHQHPGGVHPSSTASGLHTAAAPPRPTLLASEQLCIVCQEKERNASFVHGNTAHICCCYDCAMEIFGTSNDAGARRRTGQGATALCPICRTRIDAVVKNFQS
ncbi:unnamed protein product [Amoebophrya sp. A120]|nr:unnamed protein product [Amoebophrya sp. A120]|eukprot:GSA120T00013218001.1